MTSASKSNAQDAERSGRGALRLAFFAFALCVLGAISLVYQTRAPREAEPNAVSRFRVQSRSMEPAYFGPRFDWRCDRCDRAFTTTVDVEAKRSSDELASFNDNATSAEARAFLASARYASCPFCGNDQVASSTAEFRDGDEVDGAPQDAPSFARWEAGVFRDAQGRLALKRTIGLPGERVSILNGDVYVDGKIPRRTPDEIFATAISVFPVAVDRIEGRATISRVSRSLSSTGESVELKTAITNESTTPSWNGANTSEVEFARDFILRFDWTTFAGGSNRVAVLARRPSRAWLLEIDAGTGEVVARSTPLLRDKTAWNASFETLEPRDFHDAPKTRFASASLQASEGRRRVEIMLVDGEIAVLIDGTELARFDSRDAEEETKIGIATPFVLLGDATRAQRPTLWRDLHYSSVADSRSERTIPAGRYYALGDNSPASRDSRFEDVGFVEPHMKLRARLNVRDIDKDF